MKTLFHVAFVVLASALLLCACSPGSSEASTEDEAGKPPPPIIVTKSPPQQPAPVPFESDPAKRTPSTSTPSGTPTTAGRTTGTAPSTTPATAPAPTPPRTQPTSAPRRGGTYAPNEYVLMETSMGDIVLELDHQRAPISVENFLAYTERGFYDGTIFHRVIDGFMIQGGGLTPDLQQKPTDPPIVNEWRNGLKHMRGTIAMARTKVADSATSQFYINVKDNLQLDMPQPDAAYAVFGKVIAGMDTVDAIRGVDTGQKLNRLNVPIMDVVIKRVTRISETDAKQRVANPTAPASPG